MKPAIEIARREVKDNLVTWKLPLALVLTTLLLVAGVLSLSAHHRDATRAHDLVQDEYAAEERENDPDAMAHRFLGRPSALALLVGGPAEAVRAAIAEAPLLGEDAARQRHDPIRLRFLPADLGTVGVGVLSLLAILVAYDAVSGEKERGTLKLLLLNPLTRAHVLVGKYLGAMFTLLAPLGLALVLALVLLRLTGIRLSGDDYLRLLLVLLVATLFLSAFVLLALAVSATTTRSAVAMLALSVLWLLLVGGAGSLAAFAATADEDGRGADDVLRELRVVHAHYDQVETDLRAQLAELERKNETQNGTLTPADQARLGGLKRDLAELPLLLEQDQRALLAAYVGGRERDLTQAEAYAALSPAEAYRSAAQRLARTDYDAARDRLDEFSVYLREIERDRAAHLASGGTNETFQPPALRHQAASIGGDLARASPFLVALAAQNVLALVAGAVAFGRYDVR